MTKPTLQIIGLLLFCNITILSNLNAQTAEQADAQESDSYEEASYEGGRAAFLEYFEKRIVCSDIEEGEDINNKCFDFVMSVGTDGTASIMEFMYGGANDSLKMHLEAIVSNMPKWKPTYSKGKPIESIVYVELACNYYDKTLAFYDVEGISSGIFRPTIPRDQMGPHIVDDQMGIDTSEIIDSTIPKNPYRDQEPEGHVSQKPMFPGGEKEMDKFIETNLQYPEAAKEQGIQGRVIVSFVVNRYGGISDVEVRRGIDPECDKEAVRIVEAMPRWYPGKHMKLRVPVYQTLQIIFGLDTGFNVNRIKL